MRKTKEYWLELIDLGIDDWNRCWDDDVDNTKALREKIYKWSQHRIDIYPAEDNVVVSDIVAEYFKGLGELTAEEKKGELIYYKKHPLIIVREAVWGGLPPDCYLEGIAVDRRGKKYMVRWCTTELWDTTEADYQRARSLYEYSTHEDFSSDEEEELGDLQEKYGWARDDEPTIPDFLDDMSNAADWDDYTVEPSYDDSSQFAEELKTRMR